MNGLVRIVLVPVNSRGTLWLWYLSEHRMPCSWFAVKLQFPPSIQWPVVYPRPRTNEGHTTQPAFASLRRDPSLVDRMRPNPLLILSVVISLLVIVILCCVFWHKFKSILAAILAGLRLGESHRDGDSDLTPLEPYPEGTMPTDIENPTTPPRPGYGHQLVSGPAFAGNGGCQALRKPDAVHQQATVQQEASKPVPASISNLTAPSRIANCSPQEQERSLKGNWI